MKNITNFLISLLIFSVLILPVFSLAQAPKKEGLVPCGTEVYPENTYIGGDKRPITMDTADQLKKQLADDTANNKDVSGQVSNPCNFDDIIKLINNVIDFILKYMVIPICAIMFAYAGVLLVISGGQDSARTKAKDIFTNAVIGLVIAFAAWLIVKLILSILGGTKILEIFFK